MHPERKSSFDEKFGMVRGKINAIIANPKGEKGAWISLIRDIDRNPDRFPVSSKKVMMYIVTDAISFLPADVFDEGYLAILEDLAESELRRHSRREKSITITGCQLVSKIASLKISGGWDARLWKDYRSDHADYVLRKLIESFPRMKSLQDIKVPKAWIERSKLRKKERRENKIAKKRA